MEVVIAAPLLCVPFILPFIAGRMARCFGRKFWPWFIIGLFLPLIAQIILLCLPDKSKPVANELRAVENEKVFDHLFISEDGKQHIGEKTEFSASA